MSKGERSGKRSIPRRLLSFDSVKTLDTHPVESVPQTWTNVGLTESPQDEDAPQLDKPETKAASKARIRKLPSLPLRPGTPESANLPASPSVARWETLRRHVVQTTPTEARPQSPQPSVISSTSTVIPPRSATPKPSRFARLGFRQVVDQAREVAVDDTRRLAQDIQKACLVAHYGDQATSKREPFSAASSTLHLPFMMNYSHSLPSSSNSSVVNLNPTKGKELRRPMSIQSLSTAGRAAPSVKPLHQLLAHINPVNPLPHENMVISALLTPFLAQEASSRTLEEHKVAIDVFELILKAWAPSNQSAALERCLWCCKAALQPSVSRHQLIGLLRRMLPHEPAYVPKTAQAFICIIEAIFSLLPTFHASPFADPAAEDTLLLQEIVFGLSSNLQLDLKSVEEEYKALAKSKEEIGQSLVVEALARCLEHSCSSDQRWILVHLFKEYWEPAKEDIQFQPLTSSIRARAIRSFCHAALALLKKTAEHTVRVSDSRLVIQILRTRVLPEAQVLDGPGSHHAKEAVCHLILEVMMLDDALETSQWSVGVVSRWYRGSSDMVGSFENLLRRVSVEQEWNDVLRWLSRLLEVLPHDVCQKFLLSMIPSFNEHLADNTPPSPNLMLTTLLQQLASVFPRIFYKPFFSCAASNKDVVVLNHLRVLTAISKFLPDLWMRDAEMVAVALLSDPGTKGSNGTAPTWGIPRLGQSVILMEIISSLQTVRHRKEGAPSADQALVDAVKFAMSLEARLAAGLDVKEETLWVPAFHRSLYCVLFREIRLLTKSLKPAPWLARTITWFVDAHGDEDNVGRDRFNDEIHDCVDQVSVVYELAQESSQSGNQRRSTLLLSPTTKDTFGGVSTTAEGGIASLLEKKKPLLESLAKGFTPKVLKLLVAVSALLSGDDLRRISRILWVGHLEDDQRTIAPACFLIMQCAEKEPLEISATVEVDLRSSSASTKLGAIRKLSILSHWRFQLLSQRINVDRAHRPFKLARGPLPFIGTDMGSSQFEVQEDPNELKDKLPLELRKQLAEIGWASENDEVDQRMQLIKTPLSILPSHYIDRLDVIQEQLPTSPSSPSPSPGSSPGLSPVDKSDESGLLRRNSSTGGPLYGVKRKAVFVPALASLIPRLTLVVHDPDLNVVSAARGLLMDFMRNDPALFIRPILDMLSGDQKDTSAAVSCMQALLHLRNILPPPATHHLFNHLVGFLKFISRQAAEAPDALHDYAYVISVISTLAPQVHSLAIRDFRRAKVETILVPTGHLWFPPSAPSATLFPRSIRETRNPFEDTLSSAVGGLAYITMVRVSQNLLYLEMLKKNPQDVQHIRKNITRIALPSMDEYPDVFPLELKDYFPSKDRPPGRKVPSTTKALLKNLSLMLSRSYLLLIAQVFRSLPRTLSDRSDLAVLVDGLNRVLLKHGDDIGIVGHAMIALMVASTRFRRLFVSGGYILFMPAVIKVYVEAEGHQGIRSAIEYATNRFHALHQEAFVFQSLEAAAHLMKSPTVDGEWFAQGIFTLFSSLKGTSSAAFNDAAGIRDANKVQEREALLMKTAEEQPQAIFKFLRPDASKGRTSIDDALPEEYEAKPMSVDNFVRLLLTVIAHDPATMRAELFLHLFRFLVGHFYHASSSAKSVLSEGVLALPMLLLRAQSKSKNVDTASVDHSADNLTLHSLSSESFFRNELFDKSKSPSDVFAMRQDYLQLIVSYCRSGGDPRRSMSFVFGMVDQMLKDANLASRHIESYVATFLSDFTRAALLRDPPVSVHHATAFLQSLQPVIASHADSVDLTSVLEVIIELMADRTYGSDTSFVRCVLTQICAPSLAVCEAEKKSKSAFTEQLARLIAHCVPIRGADVMALFEKKTNPSYEFLVSIVLPFALAVETSSGVGPEGRWSETHHRQILKNVWVRLVAYAMGACRGPPNTTKGSESLLSRLRGKPTASETQLTTLVVGLQIIKVALVRAQDDLHSSLPSIWMRLATLLRSLVNDGSARFALAGGDTSVNVSPMHSPRSSGHFDNVNLSIVTDLHTMSPSLYPKTFQRPRMVDYVTWSLLEFICLYRTPLVLHMRMSLREKMVGLEHDLQAQQANIPSSPGNKRVSSTMFSKPRRRLSGLPSPGSSPKLSPVSSSPHLMRSPQIITPPPASPSPATLAPHIVHLGPAEVNARRPFSSPGEVSETGRLSLKSVRVKSLPLIQQTYRRIRAVQTFMGYGHTLLPMPRTSKWGEDIEPDESEVRVWSTRDALHAITQEMRDLMEEFEDSNDILVEAISDPTLTQPSSPFILT
ncbi:Protein UNC80 C-terminal domain-containing protein [Pleurotus pulmonarius]